MHLHTSSYIFIHLHTSSYIFIHLHTSSYIFMHLHASSYVCIYSMLHRLRSVCIGLGFLAFWDQFLLMWFEPAGSCFHWYSAGWDWEFSIGAKKKALGEVADQFRLESIVDLMIYVMDCLTFQYLTGMDCKPKAIKLKLESKASWKFQGRTGLNMYQKTYIWKRWLWYILSLRETEGKA